MKERFLYQAFIVFTIAGVVCACGCEQEQAAIVSIKKKIEQTAPLEQTLSPKTNPPEQEVSTVGPSEAGEIDISYQYDPIGKRDPFKTFLQMKPADESANKENRFLTPLQRYDLDQLKIAGIVLGFGSQYALVEDDTGKGYSIRVGDYIGGKGGRVVEIQKDRVVVQEEHQDYLGNRQTRRIEKRLYTPVEGENP